MACGLLKRTNNKIIERGDRIRLRPKPDASIGKAAVATIEERLIVQPALDAIALGSDAQLCH